MQFRRVLSRLTRRRNAALLFQSSCVPVLASFYFEQGGVYLPMMRATENGSGCRREREWFGRNEGPFVTKIIHERQTSIFSFNNAMMPQPLTSWRLPPPAPSHLEFCTSIYPQTLPLCQSQARRASNRFVRHSPTRTPPSRLGTTYRYRRPRPTAMTSSTGFSRSCQDDQGQGGVGHEKKQNSIDQDVKKGRPS